MSAPCLASRSDLPECCVDAILVFLYGRDVVEQLAQNSGPNNSTIREWHLQAKKGIKQASIPNFYLDESGAHDKAMQPLQKFGGGALKYYMDNDGTRSCKSCNSKVFVGYLTMDGKTAECNVCIHTNESAKSGKSIAVKSPWGATLPRSIAIAKAWKDHHVNNGQSFATYVDELQVATSGAIGWLLTDEWRHTNNNLSKRPAGAWATVPKAVGHTEEDVRVNGTKTGEVPSSGAAGQEQAIELGGIDSGNDSDGNSEDGDSDNEGGGGDVDYTSKSKADLEEDKTSLSKSIAASIKKVKKLRVPTSEEKKGSADDKAEAKARRLEELAEASEELKTHYLSTMKVMEALSLIPQDEDEEDEEAEDAGKDDDDDDGGGVPQTLHYPDTLSQQAVHDYVNKHWLFGCKNKKNEQLAPQPILKPFAPKKWIWVNQCVVPSKEAPFVFCAIRNNP